jgi:purine-nucleoside phosphorylase
VPEVIVAVHCGLRTVGFSIITDLCLPDALEPASVPDIIATANAAEKKLRVLVRQIIQEM